MNLTGTTSITTVTTVQALNGRSAAASERAVADATQPQIDKATGEPLPRRFPWLSRITRELERASNQTPPYQPAPLIGENIDKSA